MKKEDLRIGNLVKIAAFGEDELPKEDMIFADLGYRIFAVNPQVLVDMLANPDYQIKPIELTHDWLIKFGFEWRNESRGFGAILDFKPYDEDERKGAWKYGKSIAMVHAEDNVHDIYFTVLANPTAHKIKYVHQLQNLYHALTGEELMSFAKTEA